MEVAIQLVLGLLTVAGTVFSVRYEVRSRVDALNREVIALQDRKIKLLEQDLAGAREQLQRNDVEIADLRRTVEQQARTIARLEAPRSGLAERGEGRAA